MISIQREALAHLLLSPPFSIRLTVMASQLKMKSFLIWDQQFFLSKLSLTSLRFTYLTLIRFKKKIFFK